MTIQTKVFLCVIRRRSVHDKMMSFDVMTKYGMCVTSLNKVSEHVPACSEFRAERENNKIKLRNLQKIKLHITSFEFISFLDFYS